MLVYTTCNPLMNMHVYSYNAAASSGKLSMQTYSYNYAYVIEPSSTQ